MLTNQGPIQRDGGDNMFRPVDLAQAGSFQTKGAFSKSMMFKVKSGQEIGFKKLTVFPQRHLLQKQ